MMMLLDNNEIIVSGKVFKIVRFKEEWDIDVDNPESVVSALKASSIKADIFTFQQRLPESKPKYNYSMDWDNIAALPLTTYDNWFKNTLHQNPRNKIRIAQKKGVEIREFEFNDESLKEIIGIYRDNPIRQGVPDTHYNMDFETAKEDNATFLDRATFIGAYFKDELIGYIKIVATDRYARTMGILGKISHRDKAPMNLLMAKAVEICTENKMPYLTYAKFDYGKVGSTTLQDFKLYNGFESIVLPRYYIPLNKWGKIAVKFKLYKGLKQLLPKKLVRLLLYLRQKWYETKYAEYANSSNS